MPELLTQECDVKSLGLSVDIEHFAINKGSI